MEKNLVLNIFYYEIHISFNLMLNIFLFCYLLIFFSVKLIIEFYFMERNTKDISVFPYVESFKTIKLLNYYFRNEEKHENKISTLFDKLLFDNEDSFIVDETKFCLPKLKKVPIEQTNNTSDLIQNISFLSLEYFEFAQWISILDDFGKLSLYIYYILLSGNSSEELESFMNPNYYPKGVNTLSYSFKTSHDISDKTFENINKINPSDLIFTVKIGVNMSHDYIKLLSKTTNAESMQIMYKYILNSCSLQFSNVPIKIAQSNYEDPLYLMWEEFDWKIEVNEYNQNFWFNYWELNDKSNKFCFIHIKYTKDCSFKNYKVINNEEEIKSIFKDYPPDLNIHDNGLEII